MAPDKQDITAYPLSQEDFQSLLQAQLREAMRLALVTILETEWVQRVSRTRRKMLRAWRDLRSYHSTEGVHV